jgi:hypothetical protein
MVQNPTIMDEPTLWGMDITVLGLKMASKAFRNYL